MEAVRKHLSKMQVTHAHRETVCKGTQTSRASNSQEVEMPELPAYRGLLKVKPIHTNEYYYI